MSHQPQEPPQWSELLTSVFDDMPESRVFNPAWGIHLIDMLEPLTWPGAHWEKRVSGNGLQEAHGIAQMWIGRILAPRWVAPSQYQKWAGFNAQERPWKAVLFGGWRQNEFLIRFACTPYGTLVATRYPAATPAATDRERLIAALSLANELFHVHIDVVPQHWETETVDTITIARAAWNDWRDVAIATDGVGVAFFRSPYVPNPGAVDAPPRVDPNTWFGAH